MLPKSKQEAFVDSSLYSKFSLDGWDEKEITRFFKGGGSLDAWCSRCGKPTVFRIRSQLPQYGEDTTGKLPYEGIVCISAYCTRGDSDDHYSGCRAPLHVLFHKDDTTLTKVGQYPSTADLELASLDEAFSKELDPSFRRELGTAIGLHAHGVGIGSFIYLRRIFEALLKEAHNRAVSRDGWDEGGYKNARVAEKIKLLAEHLPSRLVSSSQVYGILSKGVHELSDTECLQQFPIIKAAIELILKERHEIKRFDSVIRSLDTERAPE